jgi:hypothetical protein
LHREFAAGQARLIGFLRADGLCYFGHWNFEQYPEALRDHHQVFQQFEQWARTLGITNYFGPMDGSTLNSYRLRTNYYEQKPFWGEPRNSKSSVDFLMQIGLDVSERYHSYEFSDRLRLQQWADQFLKQVPRKTLADLRFTALTKEIWIERGNEFCNLANMIFEQNFAFEPIHLGSFQKIYHDSVLSFIHFPSSVIVWNSQDKVVGASLNLVDPTCPQTLLIKSLGVLGPYRRLGATFFRLISEILSRSQTFDSAILALMREGNLPSQVLRGFSSRVREYALFSKSLENKQVSNHGQNKARDHQQA